MARTPVQDWESGHSARIPCRIPNWRRSVASGSIEPDDHTRAPEEFDHGGDNVPAIHDAPLRARGARANPDRVQARVLRRARARDGPGEKKWGSHPKNGVVRVEPRSSCPHGLLGSL